jgi:Dolichyl-phosphate-mannose-protein mannosyltransferase
MQNVAKALLGALFVVCVYRAFTQSVVFDEALTWELYISGPLDKVFHSFSANHHFLNTLLIRLVTTFLGVSALTLRIPTLAAAALYFAAVYRIARNAFGESWTFLLAVAALALNPFVLDFMVAARGYGLALALWMWALVILSTGTTAPKELAQAGAALALSVTANLVFLLPSAALAAMGLYFIFKMPPELGKKGKKVEVQRGVAPWIWFAGPIGAVAILFFLMAPIEEMKLDQFYTGAATVSESLRSLANVSLEHSGPLAHTGWMDVWRDAVAFGLAPLLLIGALVLAIRNGNRLMLMTAGTAVFSGVALVLMHFALGRPYPEDRTGLYFLPLVILSLLGLKLIDNNAIGAVALGLTGLFVVQFLTEFNTRKFWVWDYDADTRAIGEYIAAHKSSANVRVGGSWQLSQSLGFYLFQNRWEWMEIHRQPPQPGEDFYTLIPSDADVINKLGLKEVFRGPVSGSILAVPK